jgi:hypothetical protein
MDATADSATCEANRKHVVEESVQALFAPGVPVQKTLPTARPPPVRLGPRCHETREDAQWPRGFFQRAAVAEKHVRKISLKVIRAPRDG